MLFNSFPFAVLLVLTLGLYYAPPFRKHQLAVLISSSFVFFAYHLPSQLLLLIASIVLNAAMSHAAGFARPDLRRLFLGAGVAVNLLILATFKYGSLVSSSFPDIVPERVSTFLLSLPLPIGISFFTFQGISLVVDVFRNANGRQDGLVDRRFFRHLIRTTHFISFFPQLIAGPIVKANNFMPQVGPKRMRDIDWDRAFGKLVLGYFLKMVVADNLKDYTLWITYPYFVGSSTFSLLWMLFGYSMQIFADFAGYSLIAVGLAALFGYRIMDNFHFPYISSSFSEFWRRWHISLSSWLKEYLYIPLGGNRKGAGRTYLNLLIVMFLGGLWHGAAWSYAIWGLFHGLALAIERFLARHLSLPANAFMRTIRILVVFTFVSFAWLLFKLPDFSHVLEFLYALSQGWSKGVHFGSQEISILLFSAPVVLYHLQYLLPAPASTKWVPHRVRPYAYAAMLFAILVNSGSANEFIYFQF